MVHDIIIAGAGPSAVAALSALPQGYKILISTGGHAPQIPKGVPIHPKVVSVASEWNEKPGLTRPIAFEGKGRDYLFNPSVAGGLANYWGQQFVAYGPCDPFPKDIFPSYEAYLKACHSVERLFICSPSDVSTQPLEEGYVGKTPRLLSGDHEHPASGLLAMRNTFHRLARERQAVTIESPVRSWRLKGDGVEVTFADGSTQQGRRLLLAAGVVGTMTIILASCHDCRAVQFRDHAPHWYYMTGLGRRLPMRRTDDLRHFNAFSVEREVEGKVQLFASVYRLSHAPMNLLLAMAGLPTFAKGIGMPGIMDLMTPVQVWTDTTEMVYGIERELRMATVLHTHDATMDAEMIRFEQWLKRKGLIMAKGKPKPGGGYHYSDLRLDLSRGDAVQVRDWLAAETKGLVTAIDGSALTALGCRPSGLTLMANAHQITTSMFT